MLPRYCSQRAELRDGRGEEHPRVAEALLPPSRSGHCSAGWAACELQAPSGPLWGHSQALPFHFQGKTAT